MRRRSRSRVRSGKTTATAVVHTFTHLSGVHGSCNCGCDGCNRGVHCGGTLCKGGWGD